MKTSIIKSLWQYLKPYKTKLILSLMLTIVVVIGITLAPYVEGWITTRLYENIAASEAIDFTYIAKILMLLLGIYAMTNLSRVVLSFLMTNAIQASMASLRNSIKLKMERLSIQYFDAHPTGEILSTMTTDVEAISNALQQSLYPIVSSLLGLVIVIVMMFTINVQMALISVIMIPLGLISAQWIVRKSQPMFKQQQRALANLNGTVQEMYTGFSEIKLFNQQSLMIDRFDRVNNGLRQNGFKAQFVSGLMGPVISVLTYLTISAVVIIGILNVMQGVMVIGLVQTFVRFVWQQNQYTSQMTQLSSTLQASAAALRRVFDFLDETEEVSDDYPIIDFSKLKGEIDFEQVNFSYTEQPLIQDLNVHVKPGQMVAIVGPTGAGKTTIINLLMRFYDVNEGRILIDGHDITKMQRNQLRSLFGMVLQDTWLFSGTIKENLVYGRQDATDEMIKAAAQQTKVDHFIKTLPFGYESELNEEASNISNGEKQLLTITRALIMDPKILILDEATSSVDTRLEQMIQAAMSKLIQGRTSFVIAHRLSTIKKADVILVLNEGKIIEQGTHESLLEANGFYASLYQAQFTETN